MAADQISATASAFAPDEKIDVIIGRRIAETVTVACFELSPVRSMPLPAFSAGAHIQVYLGNGMTRQYSLCNPSETPSSYVIAVQRDHESRGGSVYIHDTWKEGDRIQISAPANHFALVEGAPAMLLAAGIGITPILAMARELRRKALPFKLHYAARTPETAAFAEDLRSSDYAQDVGIHFSGTTAPNRLDIVETLKRREPDQHLYVCGPPRFIQEVLDEAAELGIPAGHLHREFFAPLASPIKPTDAFELHLSKSQLVLTISPGTTVLQALEAAGVEVPASCEVGVCGTCVTRVLEGVPDHQDVYLTDEEHDRNDQFTPCCSWSKTSRLVIDL